MRAIKQKQKDKTYLLLDKYSRGKVEREILDFSKDLKMQRQQKKMEGMLENSFKQGLSHKLTISAAHGIAEIKGFDPDIEELNKLGDAGEDKPSQEESSTDTTDADEAGDIEELLNPGDPIYFNYAAAKNIPSSLIV